MKNPLLVIWRWINDTCPKCGKELTWNEEKCDCTLECKLLHDIGTCAEHGKVRE